MNAWAHAFEQFGLHIGQILLTREDFNDSNRTLNIGEPGTLSNINAVVDYIVRENPAANRTEAQELVQIYFNEARKEGINQDIAIAQMLFATNYLRNRQHMQTYNYAGLNRTPRWNREFSYNTEGIRAHIQHLKGYSSNISQNQLKEPLVNPRWGILEDRNLIGKAKTLNELAVYWAPNNVNYAGRINEIVTAMRRVSS
jgi:hypothetical protein